jgi:peptide/nickel transport system substrate-binding protein
MNSMNQSHVRGSRRKQPVTLLLLLLLCIALVVTACQPQPVTTEGSTGMAEGVAATGDAAGSKELTVLLSVDFTSFDPNTVSSQPNTNIMHNVIETLLERDGTTPLLAESWEILDDVTWQFKLRDGVTFTNGEPFDADVVKFSIERILREDNKNSSGLSVFADAIQSVDVVDPLTVNIVTTRPYPNLLTILIDADMLPPGVADMPEFSAKGIGTGPYMVESWTPGEAMVLVRNPTYWAAAPYFERVRFRPVPEATVRSTELRSGRADVITQVPIEEVSRLEEPGLEVIRILSVQSMRIHLNAGVPPFDDVRVRQAMNYGIDRATILETLLEGAGQLMSSAAGPQIFGFNPNIEPYPYDPDMARALLAEAGYPDGIDVRLQFTDGRYVRDRAIAEVITAQLAEVGIRVDAQLSEFSQWLQVFNSDGNGFMVVSQEDNPITLMAPNFASSSQSFKRYGYGNAQVDELIERASVTLDEAEREAVYQELNQVLHDDAPWVYMWNPEDIYGIVDNLNGFAPNGVGYFYVKDLSHE